MDLLPAVAIHPFSRWGDTQKLARFSRFRPWDVPHASTTAPKRNSLADFYVLFQREREYPQFLEPTSFVCLIIGDPGVVVVGELSTSSQVSESAE